LVTTSSTIRVEHGVHIYPAVNRVGAAAEIAPIVAAADAECCHHRTDIAGHGFTGSTPGRPHISPSLGAHEYVAVNGTSREKFKTVMRIIEGWMAPEGLRNVRRADGHLESTTGRSPIGA
jgi:hypothetical protein